MSELLHKKTHLSSFQIIIFSFAGAILLGSLFLMLPFSSKAHQLTPFNEALFTATSAVCVTGLVIHDTAGYWSEFGQAVILILIQAGGIGIITVAAFFALLSGRKISLMQRSTMQEAISAPKMGGIVRLTSFLLKATLTFELVGALIMLPVFYRDFGIKGIWYSFFHSISAFCNAGFDLLGTPDAPFSSLTNYATHPIINLTIISLIIIGGIGFLTWDDIRANRLHFRQYRMQSKVILTTTCSLLFLPVIYFYFFEFQDLENSKRIFASLFQAVTPRTAGFNTINLSNLSSSGQSLLIFLMLIGGSPGSTAGGMKTTTIAVLFANALSIFQKKEDTHFFKRRINPTVIRNASTILIMYLTLFLSGAFIISNIDNLPMGVCLFETASAIGTVGLTLGITPTLSIVSQLILITLMFFGRVGGLTLIYATVSGYNKNFSKLPQEKITVG